MQLKYVGPKPIISHTGIEFDTNKEDKFIYINIALQLIHALDHKYIENRTYTYDMSNPILTYEEMMHELHKYCTKLELLLDKGEHNIEQEIQHNIDRAHANRVLCDEDKRVLENNISIMHDYILQREVNKQVYYCIIDILAGIIKRGHIDHVIIPMYPKFLHVLHSVQGSLRKQKSPIDTQLDVYKKDGQLFGKLQVIANL